MTQQFLEARMQIIAALAVFHQVTQWMAVNAEDLGAEKTMIVSALLLRTARCIETADERRKERLNDILKRRKDTDDSKVD